MPTMELTTGAASDDPDDLEVPEQGSDPGLAASSTPELLALYGSILTVLLHRGSCDRPEVGDEPTIAPFSPRAAIAFVGVGHRW